MEWIWAGVGILLGFPLIVAILLLILFNHLRVHYVQFIERGFLETPLFVTPRGQPRPEAEDVRFATTDGLKLAGCYFKTSAPRKGVVLFALEFGSNRWSCFDYCSHLIDAGFDVFSFEPRSLGESDREPGLTAMHWSMDRDIADARAAVTYLCSRSDADPRGIGWFGISKGAGAGILAAKGEPYIRCAVTDGMFSARGTLVPYMRHWITIFNKSYFIQGLLPSWYYWLLAGVAIRRMGRERKVVFPDLEPSLRRFRRPLLMIHGLRDNYIRHDMASTLFSKAAEPKELWLIPGANHNQGLHVAGDEYRRRVVEFFDKYLATSNNVA